MSQGSNFTFRMIKATNGSKTQSLKKQQQKHINRKKIQAVLRILNDQKQNPEQKISKYVPKKSRFQTKTQPIIHSMFPLIRQNSNDFPQKLLFIKKRKHSSFSIQQEQNNSNRSRQISFDCKKRNNTEVVDIKQCQEQIKQYLHQLKNIKARIGTTQRQVEGRNLLQGKQIKLNLSSGGEKSDEEERFQGKCVTVENKFNSLALKLNKINLPYFSYSAEEENLENIQRKQEIENRHKYLVGNYRIAEINTTQVVKENPSQIIVKQMKIESNEKKRVEDRLKLTMNLKNKQKLLKQLPKSLIRESTKISPWQSYTSVFQNKYDFSQKQTQQF